MTEKGGGRKQESHQSNSRNRETHYHLSLLYKLPANLATITHPRAGLECTGITEPAGERAGGCGELGAASAPGEGQGHLPERGGLRRPRRLPPPAPRPAVGVWNAETGTCRASSQQRLIQQPQAHASRGVSRAGPAQREANRRAPKEGSSPTVPLEGRRGGRKKKNSLLTRHVA